MDDTSYSGAKQLKPTSISGPCRSAARQKLRSYCKRHSSKHWEEPRPIAVGSPTHLSNRAFRKFTSGHSRRTRVLTEAPNVWFRKVAEFGPSGDRMGKVCTTGLWVRR